MAKVCYYGKYRAKVHNVDDPEKRGRIRVLCPKVLGDSVSNWCEPCVPVAYNDGGDLAVPKKDETVWVEFEAGDVNKPIYTGGWWAKEKTPADPYKVEARYIEWDGCQIKMEGQNDNNDKAYIEVTVGDVKLLLNEDTIEASVGNGCKFTMKKDSIEANVNGNKWTLNNNFSISAQQVHLN